MTAILVAPNTVEWLKERKLHVGASDAPAIMGLTPNWRTARDVAKDKLDDFEPVLDTENKFFKRGHVLEPLVKYMYVKQTDNELFAAPMYKHKEYSWMSATPDAWIIGDGFEALLECKTANRFSRNEWIDIDEETNTEKFVVPLKYWVQVQHQMAVTDQEKVFVAVLFAGDDLFDMLVGMVEDGAELSVIEKLAQPIVEFEVIEVARDDRFIKKLIGIENEFWNNIEDGVLPVDLKYMNDSGQVRVANYEEECLLTNLKSAYLQKLLAEEEYKECVGRMKKTIGADAGIYSEYIGKVTYKKSLARNTVNWKNLALELLNKFVDGDEQLEIKKMHTTVGDIARRFCIPNKYWTLN